MITFGFKNRKNIYARAVTALVLGLLFIAFAILLKDNMWTVFIKAAGAAMVLMGAVMTVNAILQKHKSEDGKWTATLAWMLSSAILLILVGIAVIALAKPIKAFFNLALGIALLLVGLYQLIVLASTAKVVKVSPLLFVMPAIVAVCGAVILIMHKTAGTVLGYLTGATLVFYAAAELIAMKRLSAIMKAAGADDQGLEETAAAPQEEPAAETVVEAVDVEVVEEKKPETDKQ